VFHLSPLEPNAHTQTPKDNSEGTGVWTLREIAGRHVAAPTIAAAHQMRITSSNRRQRLTTQEAMKLPLPKRLGDEASFDKKAFLKDLKLAVYAGILGSYVQGMQVCVVVDDTSSEILSHV
jgi:6-phosphogluconate dehydrogenase